MLRISSPLELEELKKEILARRDPDKPLITLCSGTACKACGSDEVYKALKEEIKKQKLEREIDIKRTGCRGFCGQGSLVVIYPEETCYVKVKPEDATEIVQSVNEKKVVSRLLYTDPVSGEKIKREPDIPFYKGQKRVVSGPNRMIDPQNIGDYIGMGGYSALAKVLFEMKPEEVIEEIKKANLRGRGGGGFPAGRKWESTRKAAGEPKYVVVNCDEGDPGAFMDRALMEGNPHRVLEGLIIGAYTIGSHEGFIYVRAEYPVAVRNLGVAIKQAEEYGFLGKDILGSGFDFKVKAHQGAGAFVAGESSALMRALEGRVSEPRTKYIHTTEKGLKDKPTNLNNVETWANVPLIIEKGAEWFNSIGTERSKGTKIFSLAGKVNNTGLVEVPMGITLREIIYEIGGGIEGGNKFKAVQTGGPSGGFIPEQYLNTHVDFDELIKLGSMMGSGGMVVFDEDTCMVDMAKFFINFTLSESCGKCVPCRVGLKQMLHLLEKICYGKADEKDIKLLEELAVYVRNSSLCALGRTAPNPVLTTLEYFRDEYIDHVKWGKCPAGICFKLVKAPCQNRCPAGTNVPGYIQLIKERRYIDAYNLSREDNPFTGVLSMICPRPCERKCERGKIDEPIAIRDLKRFMADYRFEHEDEYRKSHQISRLPERDEIVAIVGTGSGGLSTAYFLRRLGYKVILFEGFDKPVKRLMEKYRKVPGFPRILQRETQDILDLGVEVKNISVGKGISMKKLLKDFDAIFIAAGTSIDRTLGISGDVPEETLEKHRHSRQTSIDMIFVSGNIPLDAEFVIRTVGDGKEAACLIDKYLSGKNHLDELKSLIDYGYKMEVPKIEENVPRRRIKGFDEEAALAEALRCLRCDVKT